MAIKTTKPKPKSPPKAKVVATTKPKDVSPVKEKNI